MRLARVQTAWLSPATDTCRVTTDSLAGWQTSYHTRASYARASFATNTMQPAATAAPKCGQGRDAALTARHCRQLVSDCGALRAIRATRSRRHVRCVVSRCPIDATRTPMGLWTPIFELAAARLPRESTLSSPTCLRSITGD